MWPHSPAIAFDAAEHLAADDDAAARAGSEITPKTTCAPAPAPSLASDSAKQFASLASRTGRPSARSRSCCSGWPMSQVELAFLTSPVAGDTAPGIPTPTVPRSPVALSAARTRSGDRLQRAVVAAARRLDAAAEALRAVRAEPDRLDLGSAEIDADAEAHDARPEPRASSGRDVRRGRQRVDLGHAGRIARERACDPG